ncbi:hypothetical protein Btru_073994 [Bulinus truncatus]|nr:hypothetical protein Btru_073994 [Bulinus truncatus]
MTTVLHNWSRQLMARSMLEVSWWKWKDFFLTLLYQFLIELVEVEDSFDTSLSIPHRADGSGKTPLTLLYRAS